MNCDENYWRSRAVDAQVCAAVEYNVARRHADGGARQLARVYQGLAHETHLKALARLGLAAEERAGSPVIIDFDPRAARVVAGLGQWTLDWRRLP